MLPKPVSRVVVGMIFLSLVGCSASAGETNLVFYLRAEAAFHQAEADFSSPTNFPAAALVLVRASFDLADLATNDTQRAEIAGRGIAACRAWLAREPQAAAAHYYLAMNLGKLAEAEAPSLGAYKLVHEVEREFTTAAALDVTFDFAGPARNLGELYFQAPGWPLSIGSNRKALEWFERAVKLVPDYPENLLNLAEARLKRRQSEEFLAVMEKLESLWPSACARFTGERWERDWLDWQTRRAPLLAEFARRQKAKP